MKESTKQRISDLMAEAVADGTTAGLSVLVRKNGEELFFDAKGMADREQGRPVERDTIFRLYSMSKPLTAAGAMILMERGQLDLAQNVSDFLPGFANVTVERDGCIEASGTQMTVMHLLNMTSGLTYGDDTSRGGRMILDYMADCDKKLYTDDAVTTVEFADHIGSIPLAFEPDSSWCYGLSADILGAVIEKASGMRFGAFMEKELFGPLGMKDTAFWVPQDKQDRLAAAYRSVGDGAMVPYTGDNLLISNAMAFPPAFESGGAGLVSTIDDYARFAQMLLDGGVLDGVRVMSPQTARYMTTGGLTPVQQDAMRRWVGLEGYTYSHLMRILERPEQSCMLGRRGEYGWDGWLGCYFVNFPEDRMTLLLMQQKHDAGTIPLTRRIRNVLLADE